jgi:haloacetate dehalogenase
MERRTFLSALAATPLGALLEGSFPGSALAQSTAQAGAPATGQSRLETSNVEVTGNTVFVRRYGKGPAILMVHGFPRTSLMWRFLAPTLAENHTVICADLRAYGRSGIPASTDDHFPYSKRAMAKELVDVMAALGIPTFTLIGQGRWLKSRPRNHGRRGLADVEAASPYTQAAAPRYLCPLTLPSPLAGGEGDNPNPLPFGERAG